MAGLQLSAKQRTDRSAPLPCDRKRNFQRSEEKKFRRPIISLVSPTCALMRDTLSSHLLFVLSFIVRRRYYPTDGALKKHFSSGVVGRGGGGVSIRCRIKCLRELAPSAQSLPHGTSALAANSRRQFLNFVEARSTSLCSCAAETRNYGHVRPDEHARTTDCTICRAPSRNLIVGIAHVTYDRVRIPGATSRDQTITGFQCTAGSREVPIG